jgi:serine/threonine protein kinase
VALARGPGGAPCVLKVAAVPRGIPAVENEADALRALARDGVAGVPTLYDAWEGGIAIERLAFPTLRDAGAALRQSRALRDASVRGAFARLAEVHEACDDAGALLQMVHGDLSPDNVYVAVDGTELAALADFGLAVWQGSAPVEGGAFRGTLAYVAPEVARGEPFDGRADDFALAASVLHVATGIPPREGVAGLAAVTLVDAGTRPLDASHPWRTLAYPLFDRAIADALLACLAFDPRDRPRETPRPW